MWCMVHSFISCHDRREVLKVVGVRLPASACGRMQLFFLFFLSTLSKYDSITPIGLRRGLFFFAHNLCNKIILLVADISDGRSQMSQ
jgi:hypothetical protein